MAMATLVKATSGISKLDVHILSSAPLAILSHLQVLGPSASRLRQLPPLRRFNVSCNSSSSTPSPLQPPPQTLQFLPLGFLVGSIATGVKRSKATGEGVAASPPLDLTLVTSPAHPCIVAARFTQNAFCAAPVQVCKERLSTPSAHHFRALVINSGCANACTGEEGLANARRIASCVDMETANVDWITSVVTNKCVIRNSRPEESSPRNTLIASTGVIGQHLSMDKIEKGLNQVFTPSPSTMIETDRPLGSTSDHWWKAARGIMTTDTYPKLASEAVAGREGTNSTAYSLIGFSKGAGMIHPNMATMIGGIFTDANITQDCLNSALDYILPRSFNAISVDGDTSTNDSLFIFANGASSFSPQINDVRSKAFIEFQNALERLAVRLAQMIVRDGEGATKFIEIEVKGAVDVKQAQATAYRIATSPLVKTAIYGKDANWGRVICAVGNSAHPPAHPDRVSLVLSNIKDSIGSLKGESLHLFKDGAPFDTNEAVASRILEKDEIRLTVDLGHAKGAHAKMWTCDFSHDYVTINGDYRS